MCIRDRHAERAQDQQDDTDRLAREPGSGRGYSGEALCRHPGSRADGGVGLLADRCATWWHDGCFHVHPQTHHQGVGPTQRRHQLRHGGPGEIDPTDGATQRLRRQCGQAARASRRIEERGHPHIMAARRAPLKVIRPFRLASTLAVAATGRSAAALHASNDPATHGSRTCQMTLLWRYCSPARGIRGSPGSPDDD